MYPWGGETQLTITWPVRVERSRRSTRHIDIPGIESRHLGRRFKRLPSLPCFMQPHFRVQARTHLHGGGVRQNNSFTRLRLGTIAEPSRLGVPNALPYNKFLVMSH